MVNGRLLSSVRVKRYVNWPGPSSFTELGDTVTDTLGRITVRTKVSFAFCVPALTVTVIVAVPAWPAAGVIDSVRVEPLPLILTPVALGNGRTNHGGKPSQWWNFR